MISSPKMATVMIACHIGRVPSLELPSRSHTETGQFDRIDTIRADLERPDQISGRPPRRVSTDPTQRFA
jgi:hypothetical protein